MRRPFVTFVYLSFTISLLLHGLKWVSMAPSYTYVSMRVSQWNDDESHTLLLWALRTGIKGARWVRWNVFSLIMRIFASFSMNKVMQLASPHTRSVFVSFSLLRLCDPNVGYRRRWQKREKRAQTHLSHFFEFFCVFIYSVCSRCDVGRSA